MEHANKKEMAMREQRRDPRGQEASTISETAEIPEVLQNKVVETYQEVATVLANPQPVINNYI